MSIPPIITRPRIHQILPRCQENETEISYCQNIPFRHGCFQKIELFSVTFMAYLNKSRMHLREQKSFSDVMHTNQKITCVIPKSLLLHTNWSKLWPNKNVVEKIKQLFILPKPAHLVQIVAIIKTVNLCLNSCWFRCLPLQKFVVLSFRHWNTAKFSPFNQIVICRGRSAF